MERKEMEIIIKSFADDYIQKKLPEKYSKTCSTQKQPKIRKLIDCHEFEKSATDKQIKILQDIALECSEYILNEIINNNYKVYSEVDVFSADNPDKEQYGWIVYCDSEM
jgi:hypothetical protein